MQKFPLKLEKRLEKRKLENEYRELSGFVNGVDFYSNDYLGFAKSDQIAQNTEKILSEYNIALNGATGSRLLSGNHSLFQKCEGYLASFHQSEAALIFNSGYDANIGFFASVPQRGDLIFYDEWSHASIRDGIKMSDATSYKFRHNDFNDLTEKINRKEKTGGNIYIVTEAVFSMDGDIPDLSELVQFAEENGYYLIVDEAHATGVIGALGKGLVQHLKLEKKIFARIHTFGKAIGCHGAAILGSNQLREYLINFSRSFIYTTSLPPHSVASILAAYKNLEKNLNPVKKLKDNIQFFKQEVSISKLNSKFIESSSAIQSCIVPGNLVVKNLAERLSKKGFMVKPILSPTVPKGSERLRFCLHSFNTEQEIKEMIKLLK